MATMTDEIEEATGDCDVSPSETMTCDIMPTICEDPGAITGDKASLEDMMMTMLDERDKLVDHLKSTQEQCEIYKQHLEEALKDNDNLRNQMELTQTPDVSILSKNLNDFQRKVQEQEEEISELKAERNNTRLLLEHLECLVSRHERSLRMTVVKRQTQNSGGVSSEVEVLKALKSLFEHHKALDEKMREKLKASFEKSSQLEDDCAKLRREKEELRIALDQTKITPIINGPVDPKDQDMVKKLQNALESQDKELVETKERLVEVSSSTSQLQEQLTTTQRELKAALDEKNKYFRDVHESVAQKEDMEKRIVTLEKRYLNTQRESTQLHDQLDKQNEELQSKSNTIALLEEKVEKLTEELKTSEQNMSQMVERVETLPEVQAELVQKTAALNHIQQKKGTVEEQLEQTREQLDECKRELERARQREKMNEEHNQRLTQTVDKLLAESNERLQLHLKERMVVLHERNVLQNELENTKKILEEQYADKAKTMEMMRMLRQELESSKIESKSLENKLRYSLDVTGIAPSAQSPMNGMPVVTEPSESSDHSLPRSGDDSTMPLLRQSKGRKALQNDPDRVLTLNEQEWEKLHQAQIVADIQQAFSAADTFTSSANDHAYNSEFGSNVSPGALGADAETLSLCRVLQDQLDAIDKEMQLIQAEKQNTELRAEELESKIDSGSLDDLDRMTPPHYDPPHMWGFHQRTEAAAAPQSHMTLPASMRAAGAHVNHHSPVEKPPDSPHGSQRYLYTNSSNNTSQMNRMPNEQFRSDAYQHHPDGVSTLPNRSNANAAGLVPLSSQMKKKQGSFKGSLGKIFGKKYRKEAEFYGGAVSDSEIGSQESLQGNAAALSLSPGLSRPDFEGRRSKKLELLHGAIEDQIPFAHWTGPTVVAWLELWVGMPAWYVAACRANVKSGAIMSALSDAEIQREIGISNYLHRLKLRLAIQEIVEYTSPSAPSRRARAGTAAPPLIFGEMNHEWIGNEWLAMIGLPQYRSTFMECLVDARMLSHLSKKDMQRQLKVVDSFHRNSITAGVRVLTKINYDRKELERLQRECSTNLDRNLLVWSNRMVAQWAHRIGLEEFVHYLNESGIHGGVLELDPDFTCHSLALVLRIPGHPNRSRTILEREYNSIRNQISSTIPSTAANYNLGDVNSAASPTTPVDFS